MPARPASLKTVRNRYNRIAREFQAGADEAAAERRLFAGLKAQLAALHKDFSDLCAQRDELRTALQTVAEGKGEFDPDPLMHATNTIRGARNTARAALARCEKGQS